MTDIVLSEQITSKIFQENGSSSAVCFKTCFIKNLYGRCPPGAVSSNKKSLFGEFEKGTDYHHAYAFKHEGGHM